MEASNLIISSIAGMPNTFRYQHSDYTTIAYSIPYKALENNPKFNNPELSQSGIYMLIQPYTKDKKPKVYTGQGKIRDSGGGILARVREHLKDRLQDCWEYALIFTWNQAVSNASNNFSWSIESICALENYFYNQTRLSSDNRNTPSTAGGLIDQYTDRVEQIKFFIYQTGNGNILSFTKDDQNKLASNVRTIEYRSIEDLHNGLKPIPEIVTPKPIVDLVMDVTNSDNWTADTVILDPACKSGEFLEDAYLRLMDNADEKSKFPNSMERSIHIIVNQLYGIALSQISYDRTVKKMLGYSNNIYYNPDLIKELSNKTRVICKNKSDSDAKIDYLARQVKEHFSNQKDGVGVEFDIVVGNPPYQENNSTQGRQSKSVYDKFIELGIKLAKKQTVLITNNAFFCNDSKQSLRDKMIGAGLRTIINYPVSGEIFKGVGVSVCIVDIQKSNAEEKRFKYKSIVNGNTAIEYESTLQIGDLIVESKYESSICKKCKPINGSMGSLVLGDKVFGIASNGRQGFNGRGDFLDIHDTRDKADEVGVKSKFGKVEAMRYMSSSAVPSGNDYVNKYKVIIPHEVSKKSLTSFDRSEILRPGEIHTENWALMYQCDEDSIDTLKGIRKYMESKLFKFIVYCYCSNAMTKVSQVLMSHIPIQNFTNHSDIDWDSDMNVINQQLYSKYNLTTEEIEYIESIIG